MYRKIFNTTFALIATIFSCVLVWINVKIQLRVDLANKEESHKEIILILNHIEKELKEHQLGEELQELYPEGFVFINVLYGLTWAEIAKSEQKNKVLYEKGLKEARYAYKKISSETGTNQFSSNLLLEYGIFYKGWKNYLLAKIVDAQYEKDSVELAELMRNTDEIAAAFSKSESPFLESYQQSSWPADAFVGIASLKLCDKIGGIKYDTIIQNWLTKIKNKTDPDTQLLPHATNYETGETIEGTRGSSMALMLLFLSEIDPAFAEDQFQLFHKKFVMTRLGMPAIREYPYGKTGEGDIDSGPVILDMSFTGTIVSMGVYKKMGNFEMANKILSCIEGFGFSFKNSTEKRYLAGKIPIADMFIVWCMVQNIAYPNHTFSHPKDYNIGSFIEFHFLSIAAILLVILFLIHTHKKNRGNSLK